MASAFRALALAGVLFTVTSCDKPTHENIDKWMTTKKGPEKLHEVLSSVELDPDLVGHAAVNVWAQGQDTEVVKAMEHWPPERQAAVVEKMTPRLWALARIEGEMTQPSPSQIMAKDALFALRKRVTGPARTAIDSYLIDWYTGGYYEGRASAGKYTGPEVIRAIGASSGPKLIAVANGVLAKSASGKRQRIGDQLLLGMAVSAHPEAVKYVIDLYKLDRGDETQPERVMSALFLGFVDPGGRFPAADPQALMPHVDLLAAIAKSDSASARTINDVMALLSVVGMPACLPPLLDLVRKPHDNLRFRYVAANHALKCGGPEAIEPVSEGLPEGAYEHLSLSGSVWEPIAAMSARDVVYSKLVALLNSPSRVARWIAIESLGKLGAVEAAPALAAKANDSSVLRGYWGEQGHLPAGERKREPTLGMRAKEIADSLRKK